MKNPWSIKKRRLDNLVGMSMMMMMGVDVVAFASLTSAAGSFQQCEGEGGTTGPKQQEEGTRQEMPHGDFGNHRRRTSCRTSRVSECVIE
jgi:hypothetical protein